MGTRGGRPEPVPAAAKPRPAKPAPAKAKAKNARARAANARPAQSGPTAGQPRPGVAAPAPALSRGQWARKHWLELVTWVLSLGGVGVSTYLTIAHYTSPAILACSDSGIVNCAAVTTSAESMLFHIFPVAVLGLAFYLFMAVVNSPWAWRIAWPPLRWARLGSVIVGMVFVLYLIYTELYTLNAICLWCTSVHVITFVLFGLIVFATASGYGARAQADSEDLPA